MDTKLTELERKRGTRGGREERERKTLKKKTHHPSLPEQPSLVDGTGSFLFFLLIGHPGIDSGVSSSPKHVHVSCPMEHPPVILHSPWPFK